MDSAKQYRDVDFRKHPERYRIGRGEQGVLIAQPYKSEILPHWRFKDPKTAKISAETIYGMFENYKRQADFVGMDMARKYLQMGFTRSRRYANHVGGKKYVGPVPQSKRGQSGAHGRAELPRNIEDPIKAESAKIFYEYYQRAKDDTTYQRLRAEHKEKYE